MNLSSINSRKNYVENMTKKEIKESVKDSIKEYKEIKESVKECKEMEETEESYSDEDDKQYDDELINLLLDLIHKKKDFDKSFKNMFEHIRN